LVVLEGKWVSKDDGKRPYAHSITGILVISLAFFQPFIALFRCEPDSRYRFIFNYIHGFFGVIAFVLAIATLFLATYFQVFKDHKARIVMIVWTIWIVFIFITFEIIQNYYRKAAGQSPFSDINSSNKIIDELVENPTSPTISLVPASNQQETALEEKIKNIFLAIHILIAAILSIFFSTLIIT
jgi:low affinity Fe/Cu permease